MDIVRFKGGLGNQMFQYAFLKGLESKGRKAGASLGFYDENPELAQFELDKVFPNIVMDTGCDQEFFAAYDKWCSMKTNPEKVENFRKNLEDRYFWNETPDEGGIFQEAVYMTRECVFAGYWQTEKYFVHIRQGLLKDFQFSEGEERLKDLKGRMLASNNFVSVHVRRGDYLQHPELYGGICTDEYYKAAMELAGRKIASPLFVFFSDDIGWVKEHYKFDNALYIEAGMFEHYQPWYDMCLMSCCSHNIIANSSFSWWGAWLNRRAGKIVIAPEKWFNNRKRTDACPEDWIRV